MINIIFMSNISLFIMFSFFSCKQSTMNEIEKIEIYKVDFDRTSIVRVDCNDFQSFFKKLVKNSVVKSKKELLILKNYLNELEEDPDGYLPDVRAKIIIHYTNETKDTLCLSDLGIIFNGKSMIVHDDLKNFVEVH
jgi:hypothetical protein